MEVVVGDGVTEILSIAKLGLAPAPLISLVTHLNKTIGWFSQGAGRVIVFVRLF